MPREPTSQRGSEGQMERWKAIFFTKRPYEDMTLLEASKSIEGFERKGGPLGMFLQEAESSVPSWDSTVITQFLRSQTTSTQFVARAWLDDRSYQSKQKRLYPMWLTPTELRQALSCQRFKHPDMPNADRRLIYIHRLSAEHVRALIDTVHTHQTNALRDTLCKHLSFEASMQVIVPVFHKFVLEFHLPFVTLRSIRSTTKPILKSVAVGNDHFLKPLPDLSFLTLQCNQHQGQKCSCTHVIQESQISVVISGWDNHNWVGWGFFNTSSNPTDDFDPEDEQLINEDYFAADGEATERVTNADTPIWDPRCYWLHIINIRVRIVLKEWDWLVKNVKGGVDEWKDKIPIPYPRTSQNRNHNNLNELFYWIVCTMKLLQQLQHRLERTIQIWTRFSAIDGDLRFFSDMCDDESTSARRTLRFSFQRLQDLQQDLASMNQSCEKSQAILLLWFNHENIVTNVINSDIQRLNRIGTEAAIETVRAAQNTSHSARANVLVVWITTPLLLALQYFGSETRIFAFDRNPKTFVIALCVLIFALPCLTYGLDSLIGYLAKFSMRLGITKRVKGNESNSTDILESQPQLPIISRI
ncbi:hypothetical protein GQ44DRAFT_771521 [Phaeosphaeriaceae sp. PMI808]|nr:hypothetical protein GQ44DRAFT_771521 [Phaeosphaeriaceae sp. PMI808]